MSTAIGTSSPSLSIDVRRERGDEVRPGPDDGLAALALEHLLLVGGLALQAARVHLEVRHRLAAERLDELHARVDLRQVVRGPAPDGGRPRGAPTITLAPLRVLRPG